ncbi:hypothetical protein F4861DRAFT_541461 [Xylaria intraflava]|nr:hypothetical protein F4861DRAFT_541461 [Xylaria intraflava]
MLDFKFAPYTGRRPSAPRRWGKHRTLNGRRGVRQSRPQPTEEERRREAARLRDERNKRESDVKVTAEVSQKFTDKYLNGRVPPSPTALPAEFTCIHCEKVVKREENVHPWLRVPHPILKAPRFRAGEYQPFGDDNSDNDVRVWSCCGREEHDKPRKDWYNVRFTRGNPQANVYRRTPLPLDCPPTYHEPEENAAGWGGWKLVQDGKVTDNHWGVPKFP